MNRCLIFILTVFLILSGISVFGQGQHYVSLAGNFYITYPDDWEKIDPQIVDAFLLRSGAGKTTLNYDAAFCPKGSVPFYNGPYFILTVDAKGEYTDSQIDSVLNILQQSFGEKVKYFPVANFIADLKSNTPMYDKDKKVVTILNDIYEKGQLLKKHLLVMKFFKKGLATFYFYAPDSLFEPSSQVLYKILDSFSYGNIDSVIPTETLKVADLGDLAEGKTDKTKSSIPTSVPYIVGVLIVIYVVFRIKNKRKKQSS